jgi:hypothetical protein
MSLDMPNPMELPEKMTISNWLLMSIPSSGDALSHRDEYEWTRAIESSVSDWNELSEKSEWRARNETASFLTNQDEDKKQLFTSVWAKEIWLKSLQMTPRVSKRKGRSMIKQKIAPNDSLVRGISIPKSHRRVST